MVFCSKGIPQDNHYDTQGLTDVPALHPFDLVNPSRAEELSIEQAAEDCTYHYTKNAEKESQEKEKDAPRNREACAFLPVG